MGHFRVKLETFVFHFCPENFQIKPWIHFHVHSTWGKISTLINSMYICIYIYTRYFSDPVISPTRKVPYFHEFGNSVLIGETHVLLDDNGDVSFPQ